MDNGQESVAIDLSVAAVVGIAAGFAVFAVLARHQPGLAPALVIPSIAVAAGAGFLLSAGLLRRLSPRMGTALRLRRADRHPDAPRPQPILAASELGAPLDALVLSGTPGQAVEWPVLSRGAPPPPTEPAGAVVIPFWRPEPAASPAEPSPDQTDRLDAELREAIGHLRQIAARG